MSIQFFDRVTPDISQRVITDEGFLRVPARVARVGVQKYLACELGLDKHPSYKDKFKPSDVVGIYRDAAEVFDDKSLETYQTADITNSHPSDLVNAETYKQHTVGHSLSKGVKDGDYVKVDLIIKDAEAIKEVSSGKVEVSAGYKADYEEQQGTYDGESYDFVQKNIRINHIAIVDAGRAGSNVKLFDAKAGEKTMMKVTLDSKTVIELEDAQASLVQKTIDELNEKVKTAQESKDEAEAKAEAEKAKADKATEDMEEMKKETSDEAIKARIDEIFAVTKDAKAIAGDAFVCDSMDKQVIKVEALKVARPSVDWSTKDASYVNAAFDLQKESGKPTTDAAITADLMKKPTNDGVSEYNSFLKGALK